MTRVYRYAWWILATTLLIGITVGNCAHGDLIHLNSKLMDGMGLLCLFAILVVSPLTLIAWRVAAAYRVAPGVVSPPDQKGRLSVALGVGFAVGAFVGCEHALGGYSRHTTNDTAVDGLVYAALGIAVAYFLRRSRLRKP